MIARDKLQPYPTGLERPSPNHSSRPSFVAGIALVVLHATADKGSEEGAESWLTSRRSRVSAHLHIRRDGTVVRLVDDQQKAWHAGASQWRTMSGLNSYSLGWEIANRNDGAEPYTDAQYVSVAKLAAHYIRQGLVLEDFVSHAEVAIEPVGRKTDPLGWDWTRWRLMTRAVLSPPVPLPIPEDDPEDRDEEQPGDDDEPSIRIVPDAGDRDSDGMPDWVEDAADTAVPGAPTITPKVPTHVVQPLDGGRIITEQVPIHVVQPAVKPGRKSSELKGFVATLAVALGYVVAFPEPIVAATAVISAGAASLGYSISRGQAKSVVTFVADAVKAHQERTRRKP